MTVLSINFHFFFFLPGWILERYYNVNCLVFWLSSYQSSSYRGSFIRWVVFINLFAFSNKSMHITIVEVIFPCRKCSGFTVGGGAVSYICSNTNHFMNLCIYHTLYFFIFVLYYVLPLHLYVCGFFFLSIFLVFDFF